VGFTVLQLKRMRIGSLHIGEMKPGDWRELSSADVQALKRRAQRQAAKTGGDR
jgi:23S rRNA pseudouridine2605 synthase